MQKQMYIFAFLVILQEHLQLQYTFLAYCSIKMHVILNLTCIFFFALRLRMTFYHVLA